MGRKAISKSVRFAIFARDGFACKYCGKQSDQVRLVIDHILPVAKGGDNEETNLITACEPCNQGKAAKALPTPAAIEGHRLSLAQEFQEQNALHHQAVQASQLKRALRNAVFNKYCEVFDVDTMFEKTISHYVIICEQFGPDLLFEWFQIANDKAGLYREIDILKYIHGIKRRFVEESK